MISYYLFIVYLVFPKISIIELAGAAIRVGDIIMLVIVIMLLTNIKIKKNFNKVIVFYLLYLCSQVVSIVVNSNSLTFYSLLFVLRQLEYLLWFPVGLCVVSKVSHTSLVRDFSVIAMIFFMWAMLEFYGVLPKLGKFQSVQDRVTAGGSGPYEFALIMSFFVFYIKKPSIKISSAVSLLLTQSRVTILIVFVRWVYVAFKNEKKYQLWLQLSLLVCLVSIFTFLSIDSNIKTRFSELSSISDVLYASKWYIENSFVVQGTNEYFYLTHKGGDVSYLGLVGMSLEMRLLRWSVVIMTTANSITSFIFGMGPSFWGVALDGYYVRVFGETGLFGLVFFGAFIFKMYRSIKNKALLSYFIVLLVSSIFIDVFVADKPMSLFWFMYGFYLAHEKNTIFKIRKLP